MGLDVTAYSRLKPVGQHEKDPAKNEGEPGGINDWCYYDNHVQVFAYDTFPQSFRGIPILGADRQFLLGGCYEITAATQEERFHAGSYSGYNMWRDYLRSQFNPRQEPDLPFYELIFFADNEGSIGPDAARDLLTDFREHANRYDPPGSIQPECDYYRQKYASWTRACELAADGGLIRFH
jgi:hypothetical protein